MNPTVINYGQGTEKCVLQFRVTNKDKKLELGIRSMIHGFGFENIIYHLLSNLYDPYKMTDIGGSTSQCASYWAQVHLSVTFGRGLYDIRV